MGAELIIGIVAGIVGLFVPGFLSQSLHDKKGYDGGFWIGFIFGIFGLIYAAGLPEKKEHKTVKIKKGNKEVVVEDEYDDFESVKICPDCGWQVFPEEKNCSNCGRKIR